MCEEVKSSELFPFKGRAECYLCYEKVTGKTLHAFRQQLSGQEKAPAKTIWYLCTYCDAVTDNWSGRCSSCGEWNTQKSVSSASKPVVKRVKYKQEVSVEYILEYLRYRVASNQPAKIYYKDDKTFRVFYTYTFDNTYLRVPASAGHYNIMYRLDRIRNVEL